MADRIKIKSILREQIPGAPDWVDQLLLPLNDVILSTGSALNQGLTFSDNLATQLKALAVTTGAGWHTVGATTTEPAFANSWQNFSTTGLAQFRKLSGRVYLRGLVKNGTVATDTTGSIFTLPAAYWPSVETILPVVSNNLFGTCRIKTTGEVIAYTGSNTWFSLDNVSFEASDLSSVVESPFPLSFQSTLNGRMTGCVCLGATPTNITTNALAVPGPVTVDAYDAGNKQIAVRNIFGLMPSTSYNVLLLLVTR